MNTRKLILGIAMCCAVLAMSCSQSTAEDDGIYENGVDKTKLINGDKRSVDKTQLINGDTKGRN